MGEGSERGRGEGSYNKSLTGHDITQIKAAFLERLKHIETISWDVPFQASEPAWIKFAGVFKDDSDFQEIMQTIRSERNSNDESEVDPYYYL